MAIYPGTPGNDTLTGSAGDDSITGDAGNDILDGGAGNDTVDGGEGADRLIWDSASGNPGDHDIYHGGDGHTPIYSGGYVTDVIGSEGYTFDTYSHNGGDSLALNLDSDAPVTLTYSSTEAGAVAADGRTLSFDGVERVYLGDGDNSVDASGATILHQDAPNHFVGIRLYSGAGQDTITGSSGTDYIHGGAGNDLIFGGDGSDVIEGGAGDDTIYGGDGWDGLRWGAGGVDADVGNDVYYGDNGPSGVNDPGDYNTLNVMQYDSAGNGVQVQMSSSTSGTVDATGAASGHLEFHQFQNILTGQGNDTVDGSAAGVDGFRTYTGWGGDSILGSSGNDTIEGGGGADTINGGAGDDIISMSGDYYKLDGTAGLDAEQDTLVLEDGFGRDTLVAFSFGDGLDWDGNPAPADRLDVSNLHGVGGAPLHVGDVVVRGDVDQWNNPFAVIRFPNGEELWLPGVDPATLTPGRLNAMGVPCFCQGTLLRTQDGEKRVEDLAVGDLVWTHDHGLQPVRWIGRRKLDRIDLVLAPKMRPIRIAAGALGKGVPHSDLMVSPQHRMLVRSTIAHRMCGSDEVLVAARHLLELEGIEQLDLPEVEYFHLLFDGHEILCSNGAESESLYTGPEALKSVGPEARAEIFSLFPELRDNPFDAARPIISGAKARKMAWRHRCNARALYA